MFLSLCACSTYRSGGGYRSASGGFRAPSDYSVNEESREYGGDEIRVRERLRTPGHYIPRSDFQLNWPVEFVQVNRGFRPEKDPQHEGLDLGGRRGVPVLAAHEGLVIYAGRAFRGYGKMVLIEFNHQWATLYGHLQEIAVREGSIVQPGDPIGSMGSTGHATGVHLHFEVMHNRLPVDPLPMLAEPNHMAKRKATRRTISSSNRSKNRLN